MTVSRRDRDHMARLGEYKRRAHQRAAAEHLALPPGERLRRSWELWLRHAASYDWTRRVDDPGGLYDRARRLGLYQG